MDNDTLIILWVVSGYVGALWLMFKGYTGELIGCAIAAGGLPILLPAVVGPFFLLAALLLPSKHKRSEVTVGDKISVKTGSITNIGGEMNVGKVNGVITYLKAVGQNELAISLKAVNDAVVASRYLNEVEKQEQMGIITQIAEEAAKPQPNKALLKGLGDVLMTSLRAVPDVARAITAVAPLLSNLSR